MSSLIKNLQRKGPARATEPVRVPESFLAFCVWLGVALTPGQAEFARVAFDGGRPVGGANALPLFGGITDVPVGARSVVAAVCGARAGKSYIIVALRLLHGMLVRDLSSVAPGQQAVALIIAPRDKLRREVLNYAVGAVLSKRELAAMMVGAPRGDGFTLRRPDGAEVMFETGVCTHGGYGARGRALTDFALDESAFFRDKSFKVNDQEIFRAGAARVLPGGQTIVASTPWAQAGLLFELHRDNFGKPKDALVAHAPTLVLHDSEMTREVVERERRRDPDNARREFDAEFMVSGTTVFFESSSIKTALVSDLFATQPGDIVAAGVDLGLLSDSSALMIVALRGKVLHLFDGREERPGPDAPLRPTATVQKFAGLVVGRCSYVMSDSHYRESLAEAINDHGLVVAPAPVKPVDTYVRARTLLRDLRVQIHRPNLDPELLMRLLQQMREVQGRPTSGGGMSIMHPRWSEGGHGDLVSALVLALWQVSGDTVAAIAPEMGTREWVQTQVDRRKAKLIAEQERPKWQPARMHDRGTGASWRR